MRSKNEPADWRVFCEVNVENKIATIFVNGEFEGSKKILDILSEAELIVAVDGGLNHLTKLGITPHIIIGDLDSIDRDKLVNFEEIGVEIRKFPEKKDQTDLELALQYVVESGFEKIYLLGATGGRIDHFLGNLYICSNPNFADKDIKLLSKNSELFICNHIQQIHGQSGDLISLIPISDVVKGIKTQGLEYPLENEDLNRWEARGISNLLVEETAKIHFESGVLLCVHYFKSETKK